MTLPEPARSLWMQTADALEDELRTHLREYKARRRPLRPDQPISDQSFAGTKRDKCLAFVVATTTPVRPKVAACAAKMTSPSSAESAAVGRPC